MTLLISIPSIDKTINFPFKNEITINELINQILKRVGLETVQQQQQRQQTYILKYNDNELFENDTIGDLSIPDNSKLILINQSEINLTTPTTITTTNSLDEDFNKIEISNNNEFLIKQIDIIVLDISGSMSCDAYKGSREPGYIEMKRIEVAQTLFQTMIDKYVSFEVPVVAGLVLFGHNIDTTFEISKNFDSFSQELGNVEANQNSTRLYEAIYHAANEISKYKENPKEKLSDDVCFRIFLLTDGNDTTNISPYEVYKFLKPLNIILDAIPIGQEQEGLNALSILTTATGGSCFIANSTQEGVALFEREALLIPTQRDGFSPFSLSIKNFNEYSSLRGTVLKTIDRKIDHSLQGVAFISKIDKEKLEQQISNNNNNNNVGSTSSSKRIFKEYIQFQKSIDDSNSSSSSSQSSAFTIFTNPNDISIWKVIMKGEVGTPYESGHFVLSVQFPTDYPFKPPKIRFENRIYHCNINSDGNICLDILKDSWSPSLTIEKMLISIHSLLSNPNPMDPLDVVKAGIYRDNIAEYNNQCKKWVQDYASSLDDLLKDHNLI